MGEKSGHPEVIGSAMFPIDENPASRLTTQQKEHYYIYIYTHTPYIWYPIDCSTSANRCIEGLVFLEAPAFLVKWDVAQMPISEFYGQLMWQPISDILFRRAWN